MPDGNQAVRCLGAPVLVVVATLSGKPEQREVIAAALSNAAATFRKEPGCLSYAFHRDLENPDSYVSVETWKDQASLDAHFETQDMATLNAAAGELLSAPPVIETYETAGPTTR